MKDPWAELVLVDVASSPKTILGEIRFTEKSLFFIFHLFSLSNIDDVGKVGKIYWREKQTFPPLCPPAWCFWCLSFSEVLHMDYICLCCGFAAANPHQPQGNQ